MDIIDLNYEQWRFQGVGGESCRPPAMDSKYGAPVLRLGPLIFVVFIFNLTLLTQLIGVRVTLTRMPNNVTM